MSELKEIMSPANNLDPSEQAKELAPEIVLPDTLSDLLTQVLLSSPQAQALIMVHLEAKGLTLTDNKLMMKGSYIVQP